jgi:transcriptional regulator with XRE-family HTH domain
MIGQLLKEERNKAGLTQKQLAEKSGISFVAINRIEKGNLPRVSVATKLFNALGLDLKFAVEQSEGSLS